MPIPANQIQVAEVHMNGIVAAGGSTNRLANFVFHYRRTSVVNPVTKASLEAIFQSTVCVPVCAALNARYTQSNNTVRWVNDALDPPVPTTRAVVGGRAGDSMPTLSAAYILMRTALRGRSYRGSKHFFPLSESDTTTGTDDILNAAALALWATAITAMGTPLVDSNGNTWVLTILSRKLSKLVSNPTTVVVNDATLLLINKRVGRMSKREVRSIY
jgi:hypothetical protein